MSHDTSPLPNSRRRFLQGSASIFAALSAGVAEARADDRSEPPPWMREQGAEISPYGQRSSYERQIVRKPRLPPPFASSTSNNTPLQSSYGIITPSGLHYERHHAGIPDISPDNHKLIIHGLVDRPLAFTMDDLVRFPSVSRIHFLECSGNTPMWVQAKSDWSVQETHGLLSGSEWTGVPLATVLAEAGVKPEAKWILAEGADAAAMTRSIPIEKAFDDAILAYAQNGERLRPEQGYPLRLFLPGFEGNTSVKWLRRLKLGDRPFDSREETSKYTDLVPGGRATRFNFVMEVKSVVTSPSGGQTLRGQGFHEITGLAWSGLGRIAKVEVSVDGGQSWLEARLQDPVLPKALTRFRLSWDWRGGPALIASRATDEFGNIQPTREALITKRGENARYHYNAIHTWRLNADGSLANVV